MADKKAKQAHQPTRAAMLKEHATNASATKRGPGRHHSQGAHKATPIKDKGASAGFVLHQASLGKRNRKARIKALGGIRQFKRWEYAHRDSEAA